KPCTAWDTGWRIQRKDAKAPRRGGMIKVEIQFVFFAPLLLCVFALNSILQNRDNSVRQNGQN
ncbi:MAG: hypothetical protein M3Y82_00260, partial [Verrucomicrobiota bacterium]|nr:hypothetical protein [Verrucomicrobiota bacterium]